LLLAAVLLPAVLLTVAAGPAAGQAVFSSPLTAVSRPALVELCARIARQAVVQGRFTQVKHVRRLSKDFVSRGRFLFAGQRGIVWEVQAPFPSTTVMSRQRLVQRTPDGGQSVLEGGANPVFRRFADTLQAVFSGNLAAMEAEFEVFFLPERGGSWRLGLVPREQALRALIASLQISGGEYLGEVLLSEAGGDTVRYTFTEARSAEALGADEEELFR
jgi:hypothetical protein